MNQEIGTGIISSSGLFDTNSRDSRKLQFQNGNSRVQENVEASASFTTKPETIETDVSKIRNSGRISSQITSNPNRQDQYRNFDQTAVFTPTQRSFNKNKSGKATTK